MATESKYETVVHLAEHLEVHQCKVSAKRKRLHLSRHITCPELTFPVFFFYLNSLLSRGPFYKKKIRYPCRNWPKIANTTKR